MHALTRLAGKRHFTVVGLMSGTSADGIDAALIRVSVGDRRPHVRLLKFRSCAYPRGFRELLMKNSAVETASIEEITRLNVLTGELFADAALAVVRSAGVGRERVDIIGSHGQTIHHAPAPLHMFGRNIHGTLQIGDPDVIAKRTGIVTVGDFRAGDVAVNGSGAPLIPAFDHMIFTDPGVNRGMVNIGGIANITVLPRRRNSAIMAFDTGPGNMLIDALAGRLLREPFDRGGKHALTGRIITPMLAELMQIPYLKQRPPKSTGRELFGDALADRIVRRYRKMAPRDILATASEFTVVSIYDAYMRHIRPAVRLDELVVSGGGVHNAYIMEGLRAYLQQVKIRLSDDFGVPGDAKEAIAFGTFAVYAVLGRPLGIPSVTGARRPAVLGKIALP